MLSRLKRSIRPSLGPTNAAIRRRLLSTPPPPSPASTSKTTTSKFQKYLPRLHSLSTQSKLPLPSLIISFAILHELTALLPLIVFFFAFQALGIGAGVVRWASKQEDEDDFGLGSYIRGWVVEGQQRVDRVAKRYGWFGYSRTGESTEDDGRSVTMSHEQSDGQADAQLTTTASAGVANAVAAYIIVKVSTRGTQDVLNQSRLNLPSLVNRHSFPFGSERPSGWHQLLRGTPLNLLQDESGMACSRERHGDRKPGPLSIRHDIYQNDELKCQCMSCCIVIHDRSLPYASDVAGYLVLFTYVGQSHASMPQS